MNASIVERVVRRTSAAYSLDAVNVLVGKLEDYLQKRRSSGMDGRDMKKALEMVQEIDLHVGKLMRVGSSVIVASVNNPDSEDEFGWEQREFLDCYVCGSVEMRRGRLLQASMQRHYSAYKARDGKWYMELAPHEYGEREDATTYGPFANESELDKYLDNFSNPGGGGFDDSGKREVPKKSPNGRPVVKPSLRPSWMASCIERVIECNS